MSTSIKPGEKNFASELSGLPRMQQFLEQLRHSRKFNQAYLLEGPDLSICLQLASALSQLVMCDAGCFSCELCEDTKKTVLSAGLSQANPDVHVFKPAGEAMYLVDQIREIIQLAQLKPAVHTKQIFILQAVEKLNASGANALLKLIEEPPASVIFMLTCSSHERVLSTIVSRCQLLNCAFESSEQLLESLAQKAGTTLDEARLAFELKQSFEAALAYEQDEGEKELRAAVLGVLSSLDRLDSAGIIAAAARLQEPIDELFSHRKAVFEQEQEAFEDFLTKANLKKRETQFKRDLASIEHELLAFVCRAIELVFRDALWKNFGRAVTINYDCVELVDGLLARYSERGLTYALERVAEADRDLSQTISKKLALELLLFDLKEAQTCPPSYR